MFRRKKLGLKKDLVNSVAIGWGLGWMLGWTLYLILYVVLILIFGQQAVDASPEGEHQTLYIVIILVIVFGTRFFGPIGSILAFLRWRRKTLAKLNARPALAASPASG
jgi:hypothetical protein